MKETVKSKKNREEIRKPNKREGENEKKTEETG